MTLNILIGELRIYLDQTRGDGWKTNQNYFGELYLVYVEFEWSVFYN